MDTNDYYPIHYFKLFFPESGFELMGTEANSFCSPSELSPDSRALKVETHNKVGDTGLRGLVNRNGS